MLSVLTFKKSLFAGVLDGGETEVFLGGSRLTRFMETVEKTTAAIVQQTVEEGEVGERDDGRLEATDIEERRPSTRPASSQAGAPAAPDPWTGLLDTGLALLEQFREASGASSSAGRAGLRFVERDPQTGRDYLKIPLPGPDVLERARQTIGSFLERFRSAR